MRPTITARLNTCGRRECNLPWIKLAEAGIHGNGHMMMLEKNNLEIARLMADWLEKLVR